VVGPRYSGILAVEPQPADASQDLLSAQPSDRCANCGSPLAPDQRYCVECGERRGKARFSFESVVAPKAPGAPRQQPRRPRVSSSFSFIAGVATLLLALGIGVLIGHNTNNAKPTAATPNQTIKITGLGGSNTNTTANSNNHLNSKSFTAPKVHLSPKVVKKVNQAASTVLGSGTKNLSSNPTQQVGQSCSGGAGCQGGKFTGNFFGGG
jgi:hypothetical protein